MTNLEKILYSIVIIFLLVIFLYVLSVNDIITGRVETGDIRFKKRGDTLVDIISDVPGRHYDKAVGHFVDGDSHRSWLLRKLGVFWIGIIPNNMHSFTIEKTKENLAGDGPENWVTKPIKEEVRSLRYEFPRSFVLKDVELVGDAGNASAPRVHVLITCKFRVYNPIIPVFVLKGDFFRNAEGIVGAEVTDILNQLKDTRDFLQQDKSEAKGILSHLKEDDSPCNNSLREQVGLELIGITISNYDPGNRDFIDAAAKEEVAKMLGLAAKADAEAYATQLDIRTVADVKRLKAIADASGTEIKQIVSNLEHTGASADLINNAVMEMIRFKFIASSNLTTFVDKGNNPTPTIPLKP